MGIQEVKINQFCIELMDEPCTCYPGMTHGRERDQYPDGNEPKWYDDPMEVVIAKLKIKQSGQIYYGLHLGEKHVLAVYDGKTKL